MNKRTDYSKQNPTTDERQTRKGCEYLKSRTLTVVVCDDVGHVDHAITGLVPLARGEGTGVGIPLALRVINHVIHHKVPIKSSDWCPNIEHRSV